MAMEILGPIQLDYPALAVPAAVPVPPAVPPAPPLPSHWPVKHLRSRMDKPASLAKPGLLLELARDSDSGLWSSVGEDLPGCGLTDSEFHDEFSRRGSADSVLTIRCIPTPPPPPPVPSYLRDLPPARGHSRSLDLAPAGATGNDYNPYRYMVPGITYHFDDDISFDLDYEPDFDDYGLDDDAHACMVCYAPSGTSRWHPARRRCCNRSACRECMVNMVHAKIGLEGLVYIECPNPDCDAPLGRAEILDLLSGNSEMKEKFERMRLEAEGDDTKKACPNCSLITEHELPSKRRLEEEDVKITCAQCNLDWCFNCHAPWHHGITCKEFKKGNKEFMKWTKGRTSAGAANCQKCPTCRVYIQRSTGCDHMTCNRCDTHFCYKCGGRFVELPILGDHYDRVSVFGCKNNYAPNQPIKRKAVRGGYLGAKLAMLTGYPVLFVAGAVVVVAVGAVALPIYGGYRYYKFRKNTNRERRRRRRH